MITGRDEETSFKDYPRAVTFNDVSFVGSYCNKVPDGTYASPTIVLFWPTIVAAVLPYLASIMVMVRPTSSALRMWTV